MGQIATDQGRRHSDQSLTLPLAHPEAARIQEDQMITARSEHGVVDLVIRRETGERQAVFQIPDRDFPVVFDDNEQPSVSTEAPGIMDS
jgi:hypothetical protein